MKNDSLANYLKLRSDLLKERSQIERRLEQINKALGGSTEASYEADEPVASSSSHTPASRTRRNKVSLKKLVTQMLSEKSLTKEELLKAVVATGYKFSTKNPLNSMGVILYGKDPKFRNVDGKFSV